MEKLINYINYIENLICKTYNAYPLKSIFFITTIIILIFLSKKISKISYSYALLTLPATIMHELSHLTLSVITLGKPVKINLIPKKTKNGIIYGYVESSNINIWNAALIGLAPLILLILGVIFLFKYLIPEKNIFFIILDFYIVLMFIEGGIPSKEDLKIAIKSWPLLFIGIILSFIKF